ncbi:MAG: hypothetical protein JWP57_4584 [Spirosoma sp.]|nr:hypothetical protein [Spirosoma sp.]
MDTRTRHISDTLLDLYAGVTSADSEEGKVAAFNASMLRLNEVQAVDATQDDGGNLALDFTPLLVATSTCIHWLLDRLSSATGRPEEELAFELRRFLDDLIDE